MHSTFLEKSMHQSNKRHATKRQTSLIAYKFKSADIIDFLAMINDMDSFQTGISSLKTGTRQWKCAKSVQTVLLNSEVSFNSTTLPEFVWISNK